MSYPIPEEIVEEVGRLCNIIDVVGDYISLEKKGKNFLGLCPFHQEKPLPFLFPRKNSFIIALDAVLPEMYSGLS